MNDLAYGFNPNEMVRYLQKPASAFRKKDLVDFVGAHGIEMINFRYVAEDGKLKSLGFAINSKEHLEELLTYGERVDGSSLFSFISAGSSDLYVVPRYRTAFINPFSEIPAMDILCSFYTSDGKPLDSAPEQILRRAHALFKSTTGMSFKALGELEYYINSPIEEHFAVPDQRGYHESSPLSKWEHLRNEAMVLIARCGGNVKYSHSEVGNFSSDTELFEQHEIEFLPVDVEDAADQLVVAKWILRKLAHQYGVEISFAPKISEGKAGSGFHVHMQVEKDGRNLLTNAGELSETAKRMIAGVLDASGALTAFGNTIPISYLRLVPEQEAPTKICWGDRNRSVLVRVPLGWMGGHDMINDANPQEPVSGVEFTDRQTFEFRAPDGSADIHNLLSALVLASLHGLEMENSLELASSLYVDKDIHKNREEYKHLKHLPSSCHESATALLKKRSVFEKAGVFPEGMIDHVIARLHSYSDENLSERIFGNQEAIRDLVLKYIHVK